MCIIRPSHLLFFFKAVSEKKERKCRKKKSWNKLLAELEKEAGQMAEECETCEWWWKRGDWKMRRKERRLEKKVEEDGNRVALLQQRRLNAGLPGWDCWSRRLTHSHRMEGQCGCFPHWPGQILFLRNSNESDQRTLCTCSCRPFYTFSVWQQQYATRNHAASH